MALDGNATGGGAPRFSVGTVISTSLSIVFANVWSFLAIILAIGVPAAVLIVGASMLMAASIRGSVGAGANVSLQGGSTPQVLFLIFVVILGMLAYLLIQAAMTFGALQSLRGRKAEIGACISSGLSALPRVFLAALLFSVAMAIAGYLMSSIFGSIFSSLTSGGSAMVGFLAVLALTAVFIYVVILFWVFIPAIVVERAGVIDCFKRSLALTKGRRWAILGVLAVVFVANLAVSLLIKLLVNIAPMASVLLDVLAMLFFMALSAVLAAVGYTFLRAEKEGVAIDDVVTVFD